MIEPHLSTHPAFRRHHNASQRVHAVSYSASDMDIDDTPAARGSIWYLLHLLWQGWKARTKGFQRDKSCKRHLRALAKVMCDKCGSSRDDSVKLTVTRDMPYTLKPKWDFISGARSGFELVLSLKGDGEASVQCVDG
jgi:hypothetical protein